MIRLRNPYLVLIWSFGLYLLIHTTQYIGYLVASAISGASFVSIISGEFSNHLTQLGQGAIAFTLGVPFIFFVAKFLWRRPWDWIRLHFNFKLLSYGLFLGIAVGTIAILVIGLFGDIHVTATPNRFKVGELVSIILGTLGWVAFIAVLEEFIFRGIAVREWAAKWGWPIATLFGGVYFSAVHIIGLLPNISFIDVLWIVIAAIIANLLFVALYIRSNSLWLPIGFHGGWNLNLKLFFGVTMSGKESPYGLFTLEVSGQKLVTGGVFGIEASVVVMAISIIIAVLMIQYSKSGKPHLMDSKFEEQQH